jgi:hypothetical protein
LIRNYRLPAPHAAKHPRADPVRMITRRFAARTILFENPVSG